MVRLLAILVLLLPTTLWAITISKNVAITVTAPVTTCPQGNPNSTAASQFGLVAGQDGCTGAQAAGSTKITNYFAGTYGTIPNETNRPPWNVAGVDYPVGYTGTLVNGLSAGNIGTANIPSACNASIAASTLTIAGNCTVSNVTVTGCIVTTANGGTITFQNVQLAYTSACDPNGGGTLSANGTSNIVLKYFELDGNYSTLTQALLLMTNAGNLTVSYSAFYHAGHHILQCENDCNLTSSFNYYEGAGGNGSHGNVYFINGLGANTALTINDQFNNEYSGAPVNGGVCGTNSPCWDTMCWWSSVNQMQLSGFCQFDTLITAGNDAFPAKFEPNGCGNSSCLITLNTIAISNNFSDTRLDSGFFSIAGGSTITYNGPFTCSHNIDMSTGSRITGNFGGCTSPSSCQVICN